MHRAVKLMAGAMSFLLVAGVALAGAGAAEVNPTFKALHCGACHKTEGKGTGLSLEAISAGYAGKAEQLTAYLAGKGQPLINPAKAGIMASQIKKTEKLEPAELQGLVQYLLGF